MTLKLEIGYEQLLHLFRQLPPKQQKQFLKNIEKEAVEASEQLCLFLKRGGKHTFNLWKNLTFVATKDF